MTQQEKPKRQFPFFPPTREECKIATGDTKLYIERLTKQKRWLFVDDDTNFLVLVEETTKSFSFFMDKAFTCKQAIDKMVAESYDCIVLDQKLTNGNGIDLYRWAMSHQRATQVIFLVGVENREEQFEIGKIGPARIYHKDNILKPVFWEKLMEEFDIGRKTQI
jgi:DNA-binding response OmpR family regulator